jgi:hypothetical protein
MNAGPMNTCEKCGKQWKFMHVCKAGMTAKRPDPTAAQRKATERAKKAAAGLAEVRGIWAPSGRHAEVKAAAAKVLRKATTAKE